MEKKCECNTTVAFPLHDCSRHPSVERTLQMSDFQTAALLCVFTRPTTTIFAQGVFFLSDRLRFLLCVSLRSIWILNDLRIYTCWNDPVNVRHFMVVRTSHGRFRLQLSSSLSSFLRRLKNVIDGAGPVVILNADKTFDQ